MSIIDNLQQIQCDRDKFSKKTNQSLDLRKIASDKGFVICDNPASGNCLFYALSEQLRTVKGTTISHRELRKNLVQFLREFPKLVSQWSGEKLIEFQSRRGRRQRVWFGLK